MNATLQNVAIALSRHHCDESRLIFDAGSDPATANEWRTELRHAGVPVLELNRAPLIFAEAWLQEAAAFSAEFLTPVVVFGLDDLPAGQEVLNVHGKEFAADEPMGRRIDAADWLRSRQVALTDAVERSLLNQEFRRQRGRSGRIGIGWQPADVLGEGNGLQLAWSSPLPLRRIRDFAARCPEIVLLGPDADAILREVAAQGISVAGWRFAVK